MTTLHFDAHGQLAIRGGMTVHEVPALLAGLASHAGVTEVDLQGVTQVDSSALSVLLALSRAAGGATVTVHHAPPALRALSDLYGLHTLFRVA